MEPSGRFASVGKENPFHPSRTSLARERRHDTVRRSTGEWVEKNSHEVMARAPSNSQLNSHALESLTNELVDIGVAVSRCRYSTLVLESGKLSDEPRATEFSQSMVLLAWSGLGTIMRWDGN